MDQPVQEVVPSQAEVGQLEVGRAVALARVSELEAGPRADVVRD